MYSADDDSLTFYRDAAPDAGTTYDGKTVTAVYTGFESRSYSWSNIPWSRYQSTIKSVATDPSFADVRPISCAYWFYDFFYCKSIDLAYLDTSAVTSMDDMFAWCSWLEDLDVSGFDTSSVSDMDWMFAGCTSLEKLDVSGFDTSAVTTMYDMFEGCFLLEELDVSGFDTGNVRYLCNMFAECASLKSLDVSNFDTSSAEQMYYMFADCSSLTSLDLSGFDLSSASDIDGMFMGCSSLTSLDTTGWDLSSVEWMGGMFYGCTSLTSLDLSAWDTSSVQDMEAMFMGCSSLTSLDLSGWDTGNVVNATLFLTNSYAIRDITIGDGFDLFVTHTAKLTSIPTWYDEAGDVVSDNYMRGVFGAGTYYTYAHIDEGMFDVDTSRATYTGSPIEPMIVSDLEAGVDYAVECENNTDVGTATMTITGLAPNYGGTLAYEFEITPAPVTITCADASKVEGAADPTLYGAVEGLVKYGDLGEISYVRAAGEDAGTYAITASYTPNADYDVTVVPGTFTITAAPSPTPEPIEIEPGMFAVDTTYGIYDGSTPVTKDIESDLVEGVDYTVAYAGNDREGEATITITGIGDYTGTLVYEFKVMSCFEDVWPYGADGNDWYFDAVYGMADLGCITGYYEDYYGDGRQVLVFNHDGVMDRAQLATVLWRMAGEPVPSGSHVFKDVDYSDYYGDAVDWAFEAGVITGYRDEAGDLIFDPSGALDFEALVTMTARAALGSEEAAEAWPQTALDDPRFTDAAAISDWARSPMAWAIDEGMVTGSDNGDGTYTLDPGDHTARGRGVTVLWRAHEAGLL